MRVRGIERLVDVLEEQQDYRSALNYAQQLLRVDSLKFQSLKRLDGWSRDT
ncbi:MAG TPA: hypothetical protein V6D11_27890 [Waterburya sp.]|jgi:hypothetical protein